jgi:hypothetical protein
MLHWFRTRHKPLRRALFALFSGAWLFAAFAPCTMAAPLCPPDMSGMHCPDHQAPPALDSCDTAAKLDCQLPDLNPPSAAFAPADLAVTPVVLAMLPIANALPEATAARQHARNAARTPPPPLNLRHAVLLI